jgi:hypothetical protein
MTRFSPMIFVLFALAAGCNSRVRDPGFWVPEDGGGTDPSCPDPSSIIPDITCGAERPEVLCAGSCGQTLEGVVGVGLSSCRCMDTGSGFGGQWICDTSACDGGGSDGGAGADGGTRTGTDAGPSCAPRTFSPPSEPGCTTSQLYEIMSIVDQADYDAFVADPANTECNTCLSVSALSCATSMGCADEAGNVLCCLESECGEDVACRDAALTGACSSSMRTLNSCVTALPYCNLIPEAPPAECFP